MERTRRKTRKVNMNKIALLISIFLISGCIATHTALTKNELDIKTKMSETVFLNPVSDKNKTLYLSVRNTSGREGLELEQAVAELVQQKGYVLVKDPEIANFILQANILQAGKIDDENSLYKSLGDAAVPGVIGGVLGSAADDDMGAVIGAVAGVAVGMAGSSLVQDVTYSIIADIQISQRKSSSPIDSSSDEEEENYGEWRKYVTRVVSYANKVNLDYDVAENALSDAVARSVAGVF